MAKRRPATRLPAWHEWSIYVGFALLLLSGLAWLMFHNWVRIDGEFGPEQHPAEHVLLIVHGCIAYALLVLAGALIPVHMVGGWKSDRNKVSGTIMASVLVVLTLSGLALYYLGGELAREWTSLIHWLIGITATLWLAIHALSGRRRKR